MIDFLTTLEFSSAIEKVIRNAKKRIVILSPFLQISPNYIARLHDAEDHSIKIIFIFGKKDLKDRQYDILSDFNNLELYFCQNLHAKCYMNETTAILGSMNLYEFSQINNFEMGVTIQKDLEPHAFTEIEKEYELIKKSSIRLVKNQEKVMDDRSAGFCIRCGNAIALNPNYPLCRTCYDIWSQYGDPNYLENFCHSCRQPGPSSMAKPLCYSCHKRL